ncbi:MAG: translocation/assembly module TamB domain-containing protein [Chthoniobacteraceae bacterium]
MSPEEPAPADGSGRTGPRHGRGRKGRRIGKWLLILLALLIILHRPILIAVIHSAAIEVAAKQNVRLSLTVDGTIFTNLSLRNITAVPNGTGPTPVENISIEEVTVRYSIPSLIRNGVSEFLRSYTLRNATIAVKPVEGTTEQKSDLASTLHGLIQQPALFSDRVDIDNLNLVAHVPDGEFAVKGLWLLLDPVRQGSLNIAVLQIPKVRTWRDLSATTTYARRDLILRNLALDPQIVIEEFALDASQRAQGINRLQVDGKFFGGSADFSLLVKELPGSHENNVSNALAQVDSTVSDLSLEKVSHYFNASTLAIGSLGEAAVHLTGDPNAPASWTGAITADAGAVRAGGVVMDKATVRLDASKGWGTFGATLFSGSNSVTAQASGKLPDSLDGFAGTAITGWLDISAGDLHSLWAGLDSGGVKGDGTFDLRDKTLRASINAKADNVSGSQLDVASGEWKMEMTKALSNGTDGMDTDPFDGLEMEIEGSGSDVRVGDYAVDSAGAEISVKDGIARIARLAAARARDTLSASGTYTLPRDPATWDTEPGNIEFSVNAPSIAAFNAEPNLKGPDGNVQASGSLSNGPGGCDGSVTANVTDLHMQDFSAKGLRLGVTIRQSVATIDTLAFSLNATDGFTGTGHLALRKPYAYDGALQANIRDLSKFNGLLPNLNGGLAGALSLDWRGKGDLATLASTGDLQFSLKNGNAAGVQNINAAIAGSYSPQQLNFPTFGITSSRGDLSAVIAARSDVLRVNDILFKQGGRPMLTGSVAIPLDLRTPAQPETLVPVNGPIFADLVSGDIALDTFFPKGQGPATGTVKVSVTARGAIDQPNAHVVVAGRALQARAAATLAPATLDADLTLLGDQLSLKARLAQPSISPVDVAGTIPLPLKQCLLTGRVDPNSPVRLSVRVPRSSLAFITRIVPMVRYIQGTAEASVDVAGTIAKPALSGAVLIDLPAVRLNDPDMPSVSGFRGEVRLAGDQLTLGQFGGNLSGGRFDLSGGVRFTSLLNPLIDLHFVSHGDLILRNESVTVRSDSDIRVTGPFAAASVTGDIGITKSRFFKEIEILPLQLPGRPAPAPPSLPSTTPSIDIPPLNNWKFALKIHTKDPFIIQGNLANGQAIIDLRLGGTGKAPTLDGSVRIENFVASLPFSKLRVTNGFVYFSQDNPFVPQLNIQAVSNMQDYNINVFIYGPVTDPKTVMSSEPPLPQEDIVSLLATGATTSNLSNGNALAARAAALLLQQLYHKVFKSKPPSDNESFVSRFKVDVGGVDPRTGQQEISSTFKLTDDFYLVGDLDVGGDIRGMVRYLLRFK